MKIILFIMRLFHLCALVFLVGPAKMSIDFNKNPKDTFKG